MVYANVPLAYAVHNLCSGMWQPCFKGEKKYRNELYFGVRETFDLDYEGGTGVFEAKGMPDSNHVNQSTEEC